jgi:hypothetical protein
MGFLRKQSGVQDQIDQAGRNAAAQEANTKQAAAAQQQALMASAKQAADQQSQLAARDAAAGKASDAAATPLASADVQLQGDSSESATASRNRKRVAFGRNYSTGVSV